MPARIRQKYDIQVVNWRILHAAVHVIKTGSIIATAGLPGYAAYAASKAGVRAMARTLAPEQAASRPRIVKPLTLLTLLTYRTTMRFIHSR